jgi:phosphoenolpyruvate-protein phosphotransferase (PTS system enzyme I)
MIKLDGIAVSSGVSVGRARILTRNKIIIEKKKIKPDQIDSELKRFSTSVEVVKGEINQLIRDISDNVESAEILKTHKLILEDPGFEENVTKLIKEELHSLDHAVHKYFTNVIDLFKNMKNDYFAERSSDYEDVAYRLLNQLIQGGKNILDVLDEDSIVIANNISPSGVTKVYSRHVLGICTEKGNKNSHSSIIARSMNLPYVARIHNLLEQVKNDDLIILDGVKGQIIINPDNVTVEKYRLIQGEQQKERTELNKLIGIPAVTEDKKEIGLMCNIEIPDEVDFVKKIGSAGIGLFRTEFLFIDRDELPAETEQYEIYRSIAESIQPHPLVIRTIDVGGDKLSRVLNLESEENPNLGVRGIRISLQNIPIFKTQIKAILRASVTQNIRIMFPMISSLEEMIKVKQIVETCKQDLHEQDIPFDRSIKIGAMIEIPSAAITSDSLAAECDFLSIGTNDLIQYTLAVDRDNQTVDEYYIPHHPSVLKLIKLTAKNAHEQNIPVAVCGEMASQQKFIPLLVGLGIDELSVSPGSYLKIKKQIINSNKTELIKECEDIIQISSADKMEKAIEELGKKHDRS